jgi:hypothetical protein
MVGKPYIGITSGLPVNSSLRLNGRSARHWDFAFSLPLGLNQSEQFGVVLPVLFDFGHEALKMMVTSSIRRTLARRRFQDSPLPPIER